MRGRLRSFFCHSFGLLALLCAAQAHASAGYLSQPDIHSGRVVFTAEGDLWLGSAAGGPARRLTTHEGREYFPRFSPDGTRIAFTGSYDGNLDVYVVPAGGGEPKRLTWHPFRDEVLGWEPDGSGILFRSRRADGQASYKIFSVPSDGGDIREIPLGWAARLEIDPDSGTWAFNRITRETRTWKRYRGGTAQDIWVGHPDRGDFRKVTDFDGTDAFPMWHNGRVFFLSDRGGTANIWSVAPNGSGLKQHTAHDQWDVRWPAAGPGGAIVYQLGADIHKLDLSNGRSGKIPFELPSDRTLTRQRYPNPQKYITGVALSPDGTRLAVTARGEIFSVPVEEGVTLRLTDGTGARERSASFDGDGERVVYISDEAGEEAIHSLDAWGRGEAKVHKPASDSGWHFPPRLSPDGKWLAYGDEHYGLYVQPAKGGKPRLVDRSVQDEIRDYAWSPDSRWLAYSMANEADFSSVYIYDTRSKHSHAITGDDTHDYSPAWDPKGRYLYFVSDRDMNPYIGWRDFATTELKTSRVFLALLHDEVENPLAELNGLPGADSDKNGKSDDDKEGTPKVKINFDGIDDHMVALPMERGNFGGIEATDSKVFIYSMPVTGMAEQPGLFGDAGPQAEILAFDLGEKEAETFVSGVSGFWVQPSSNKIAIMKKKDQIYVVGTGSKPSDLSESKVDLSGMVLELDPQAEWRQIYYEGWRLMRDFHWDDTHGGLDWKAVRDQYASLLPRLSSREDLRDLLGELIGELATSHTYVWGGDQGTHVESVSTGLLGADVERDGDGYRITKIYRGDAADNEHPPLLAPEANVREGAVILSVNHRPFPNDKPFHAAFEALAGKKVLLTVRDAGSKGTRDVVVTPVANEIPLRYADWVRTNREYVAEKTDGRIGYIHIPDMGQDGMVEFDTWFYPQVRKEGMVVDVRWNGGGFVSQLILERLRRSVVSFDRAAGGGLWTYPYRTLNGPFVVLTNQFAGSDGDIFPTAIQLEGLAPVIGMRSWGGVVGIRANKPLVDGGMLTQPEFAWWDPKDGWTLENRGVVPDIEVENLPQDLIRGADPQLDRGIAEVLKMREEGDWPQPDFGPAPRKTRDAFGGEMRR